MINNPIKISSLHRSFFFTKPSKHQSFDHHSICEPTKFPSPFAVPASDLKNRGILKNNTVMAVSRGKKHRDGQSNLGNKLYILIYIYIYPIGSMVLLYMVTFTINIPPMLAYIPYMDPMVGAV